MTFIWTKWCNESKQAINQWESLKKNKYIGLNDNENKSVMYQYLWTTTKEMLRGISLSLDAYSRGKSQKNNLSSYFKN